MNLSQAEQPATQRQVVCVLRNYPLGGRDWRVTAEDTDRALNRDDRCWFHAVCNTDDAPRRVGVYDVTCYDDRPEPDTSEAGEHFVGTAKLTAVPTLNVRGPTARLVLSQITLV